MKFNITLNVSVLTDGGKPDAEAIAETLSETLEDAIHQYGYLKVLDLQDYDPRVTIGDSEVTPA